MTIKIRLDEFVDKLFGMRRETKDTCRLYTDLAWLWLM